MTAVCYRCERELDLKRGRFRVPYQLGIMLCPECDDAAICASCDKTLDAKAESVTMLASEPDPVLLCRECSEVIEARLEVCGEEPVE